MAQKPRPRRPPRPQPDEQAAADLADCHRRIESARQQSSRDGSRRTIQIDVVPNGRLYAKSFLREDHGP